MAEWSLSQARNRFSEVVKAASARVPQLITRRGKAAVVVVALEEYERLRRLEKANAPTFVEMLLEIPQDGQKIEQMPLTPRPFDFCQPEDAREN